jgi:NTE family protein
MQPEEEPKEDWARHAFRVLDLVDNQVRSLRKRQLIQAYVDGERTGVYWGIRTDIEDYPLNGKHLPCPHDRTLELAAMAAPGGWTTRCRKADQLNTRCAMQRFGPVDTNLALGTFPYPGSGV